MKNKRQCDGLTIFSVHSQKPNSISTTSCLQLVPRSKSDDICVGSKYDGNSTVLILRFQAMAETSDAP